MPRTVKDVGAVVEALAELLAGLVRPERGGGSIPPTSAVLDGSADW